MTCTLRNPIAQTAGVLLIGATLLTGCGDQGPPVTWYHPPAVVQKRNADFTFNLTGELGSQVDSAKFKINDSEWQPVGRGGHRVPEPMFIIEIFDSQLVAGTNRLSFHAFAGAETIESSHEFRYVDTAWVAPFVRTWEDSNLVIEDGYWNTFQSEDGQWRVRPKPGHEGYDRICVVAGAFDTPRRIETDLVFRHSLDEKREYGFGVMSLWGGRPDEPGYSPRRGWNFAMVWYWNRYKGGGNEFSYRHAHEWPKWVNGYRDIDLEPNVKYRIIVEVWPELDSLGNHICYYQRSKWFRADAPEPDNWIDTRDIEGAPLPARQYGLGLMAYRCQVDFGPVHVFPLGSTVVR